MAAIGKHQEKGMISRRQVQGDFGLAFAEMQVLGGRWDRLAARRKVRINDYVMMPSPFMDSFRGWLHHHSYGSHFYCKRASYLCPFTWLDERDLPLPDYGDFDGGGTYWIVWNMVAFGKKQSYSMLAWGQVQDSFRLAFAKV